MKMVSLNDLGEIVTGSTPSSSEQDMFGGNIPFVTPGDLESDAEVKRSLTEKGAKNSRTVKAGSTLVCCIGATIGKVGFAKEVCAFNQQINAVEWSDQVFDKYGFYALNHSKPEIIKRATSTTLPILKKSEFVKIKIPLPPLPIQKKIAAVLEKADELRRKREEQIKRLDDLLQATFLDMFGDPVTNPKGWPVKPFKSCIASIQSGWSAKGENRPALDGEHGVLKISSVTTGRFISSENKFVENIDLKRVLIIPKKGDLFFSRANTRELVAAACLVEEDYRNLFLPDKLWKIEPIKNISTREFLRYAIMDPGIHERITTKATGTSGSMLNVSQQKFLSVELPVPPFQLQTRFSGIFWKVIEERRSLVGAATLIESNFNSLMQRAFKGELTFNE